MENINIEFALANASNKTVEEGDLHAVKQEANMSVGMYAALSNITKGNFKFLTLALKHHDIGDHTFCPVLNTNEQTAGYPDTTAIFTVEGGNCGFMITDKDGYIKAVVYDRANGGVRMVAEDSYMQQLEELYPSIYGGGNMSHDAIQAIFRRVLL